MHPEYNSALRSNTDIFNMLLPAMVSKLAEAKLKVYTDGVAISRGKGSVGKIGDFIEHFVFKVSVFLNMTKLLEETSVD